MSICNTCEGRLRIIELKLGVSFESVELTQDQMRKVEALRVKIRLEQDKVERERGEGTSGCSRQEDGRVGKVGGSSEEWGASEAGGGTGAGGTERSNGKTIEGDESGRLCKA
ncbi:hypothetical protein GH714_013526 [Hevea brasiliensis]|uniref:Uncharacterized protein n=1 Tax=Hevea brasiliensis TaxID=3981 RepID=A0A6A6LSP3_HEVBR|nr:hypothetical protein GH714_013526 [Hevea brasiliensis]